MRSRQSIAPARRIATWLGGAVALAGAGWLLSAGHDGLLAVAVGVAVAGVCALAVVSRGALIAVMVLGAMNGIPFIDTSTSAVGQVHIADLMVLTLIGVTGLWLATDRQVAPSTRLKRATLGAAAALFIWWLATVVRTTLDGTAPLVGAVGFGRDFMYLAVLCMTLPWVNLTRKDMGGLVVMLGIGVMAFAVGQIAEGVNLAQLPWLVHSQHTLADSGLTRVYASMTDLGNLAFACSVAASLMAPRRELRLLARPIAVVLLVSVAVQLTRARWIGLTVGFLVVTAVVMLAADIEVAVVIRRRVRSAVLVMGAGAVAFVTLAPAVLAHNTISQRFISAITDLEAGSGTVGVRESVASEMAALLGGRWPVGLGFIPPLAHYYADFPMGSIRDSDLGVLNAVMTMGAIGATLLYIPVVLGLAAALRAAVTHVPRHEERWLFYGIAVWLVAALVSSVTLVTLFSVSGLTLTGVVISVALHGSADASVRQPVVSGDA